MKIKNFTIAFTTLLLLTVLVLPAFANDGTRQSQPVADSPATIFTEALDDNGFELGTPNPFWTETEVTFGTPLCEPTVCGTAGVITGPRTGTWWAWFGGQGDGATTSGTLSQSYVQDTGPTMLTFYYEVEFCSGERSDVLDLTIDGISIWSSSGIDPNCGIEGYQLVAIDITSFGAGTHMLEFSNVNASELNSNFFVDDVSIDTEPLAVTVSETNTVTSSRLLFVVVLVTMGLLTVASLKLHRAD